MGKVFTPENINSGFNTNNSLNTNFENIETALEDCLSRSGATPNAMGATLDMNGNGIANALFVNTDNLSVGGSSVPSLSEIQSLYAATQAASDSAAADSLIAETAAAEAAASAAGVNLPALGTAGQILQVNSGATALENHTPTSAATADAVVRRDASARMQAADPSVDADVATKGYVDTADTALSDSITTLSNTVDALGATWLLVDSAINPNMSNVPAAHQGPGLYALGENNEIYVMLPIYNDAVSCEYATLSYATLGTNDLSYHKASYDSGTGAFGYLRANYVAGSFSANAALPSTQVFKLVVA